jgi:GT2 family glycosyltransferase
MSGAQPSVWLIVLSYNGREILRRCLSSLQTLTYPRLTVLVVDNASHDGSEEMTRAEFPGVEVLQTGANLGYTGGNNRGIERALKNNADYALILNPDTVVANPHFIEEMVAYLEAHVEVGIAGPRVFLREAGVIQNTVLFAPGFWRNFTHWFRYRLNPAFAELSADKVVEAETLNGVCLLLRAKCLKEIGLFDENIFMYIEDADLDYRARRAGWQVCYLPIDSVIHEQKREGYGMTSQVSFLLRRNSVYFLRKIGRHFDAWGYALASLALMFGRGLIRLADFGEYIGFCRRLGAAYWQILTGRRLDKTFGPPYV